MAAPPAAAHEKSDITTSPPLMLFVPHTRLASPTSASYRFFPERYFRRCRDCWIHDELLMRLVIGRRSIKEVRAPADRVTATLA